MRSNSFFFKFSAISVFLAAMLLQGCANTNSFVNHALIIGLSSQQRKGEAALPIAESDANFIGKALSINTGISSQNLKVVTGADEHITKSDLLDELHQFAKQTNKNDVVWLSVTGRRFVNNGQFYLRVYDSISNEGKPVLDTYISINEILLALKEMQAKTLIISFVYCQEGIDATNINKTSFRFNHDIPPKEFPIDITPVVPAGVSSEIIIMSCQESEVSYGYKGRIPGTFLSLFLYEGLNGFAANGNKFVTLGGLLHYVQDNLFAYSDFTLPTQNAIWAISSKNKKDLLQTILSKDKPDKGEQYIKQWIAFGGGNKQRQLALWTASQANIIELHALQRLIANGTITGDKQIKGDSDVVRSTFLPVIQKLEEAITVDPTSSYLYSKLIAKLYWLKEDDLLQKYCHKFSAIDPFLAKIWLAKMYERNGNLKEAEKQNQQAIKLNTGGRYDTDVYQLALLLIKKKEYVEAKQLLKEMLKTSPEDTDAQHTLEMLSDQNK